MSKLSMEWIVVLIMGIIWNVFTYVAFMTAKLSGSKYIILTIPFFLVGAILTIGGIIALTYNIVTKKNPDYQIVTSVVFETIGLFFVIMSIIMFSFHNSFGELYPGFISLIFVIEGIRLIINKFGNKRNQDAILYRKQLHGFKGITAMQWWFGYVWILLGIALLIYATNMIINIIGVISIAFGLYCYIKKTIFYIKLNNIEKNK